MKKIERTELVQANIAGGCSKGKQQPPSTTVNVNVTVNCSSTSAPVLS